MEQATKPRPIHQTGTRKGEEIPREEGREAGRHDAEQTGAGRRSGRATPRIASGIVTKGPIDPQSPYLPPP